MISGHPCIGQLELCFYFGHSFFVGEWTQLSSVYFTFGIFLNYFSKNHYCLFYGVQGFYEYIKGASILEFLKDFLSHEDPNMRAKACSALGNMCRHSAYFYSSLVSIISNAIYR